MDAELKAKFTDVAPIFNSAAENCVVKIDYSEEFAEVFAYFRALIRTDERSERALQLTEAAALQNPANYTVWQYRRNILQTLKEPLDYEFEFTAKIIEESPKNYQVWHHRRVIVEWSKDASRELEFTAQVFKNDAKNYHAWQHRQWVVREFDLWESALDGGELGYSLELLADDLRNNSAWNYRFFVVSNTGGFTDNDVLQREMRLTMDFILKAPHNESAWNYLAGALLVGGGGAETEKEVRAFCEGLYAEPRRRSPQLLAFVADAIVERAVDASPDERKLANKYLDELMELDPVRKNYWTFQRHALEQAAECAK